MAAAAGKKATTSLSLFMEAFGLEVEEELSTKASQTWAEGVWVGKWCTEEKEAWMEQICEVQTWRQVMGPARAVMCETRDLGIKWPHTLTFEGQVQVDMRPTRREENAHMKQTRSTYWRKWCSEAHEYEELKESIWLEPALALLRRTTKDEWTDKHRHVARKLVLEGGWVPTDTQS